MVYTRLGRIKSNAVDPVSFLFCNSAPMPGAWRQEGRNNHVRQPADWLFGRLIDNAKLESYFFADLQPRLRGQSGDRNLSGVSFRFDGGIWFHREFKTVDESRGIKKEDHVVQARLGE